MLTSGWPAGSAEGAAFDTAHVLQLCHAHAFKDGLLFLFERMQAHTRQLQVCLSSVLYALQVGAAGMYTSNATVLCTCAAAATHRPYCLAGGAMCTVDNVHSTDCSSDRTPSALCVAGAD